MSGMLFSSLSQYCEHRGTGHGLHELLWNTVNGCRVCTQFWMPYTSPKLLSEQGHAPMIQLHAGFSLHNFCNSLHFPSLRHTQWLKVKNCDSFCHWMSWYLSLHFFVLIGVQVLSWLQSQVRRWLPPSVFNSPLLSPALISGLFLPGSSLEFILLSPVLLLWKERCCLLSSNPLFTTWKGSILKYVVWPFFLSWKIDHHRT